MSPTTKRRAAARVAGRPAETAGGLAGFSGLITAELGGSTHTVALVGIAAGAVPSLVTWWVTHGGYDGLVNLVRHGRRTP